VEANPSRAEAQRRRLAEAGLEQGVQWRSPAEWEDSAEPFQGCVLANEILDAMPVHRIVFRGNAVREILVDWQDGLVEITGPVSRPEILEELERHGFKPREEQEVEVGLASLRWIRRLGARLKRGYALLLDYGHTVPELYSPRHQRGTLMAYHQHRANEDYLKRVGFQDLTAHVNFSSIAAAAREAGLTSGGPVGQARFLLALGALDFLGKPGDRFDLEEFLDRKAIQDLFAPRGLGGSHQVLVLGTSGMEMDLTGLRTPERWTPPAPVDSEADGPRRGE
jgi:SAM-dependent MidA family methyltransferase